MIGKMMICKNDADDDFCRNDECKNMIANDMQYDCKYCLQK